MGAMASKITSLTIVYDCLFRRISKKTSKLRVAVLCAGNSPVTGEFPAQKASKAPVPLACDATALTRRTKKIADTQ